MKYENLLAPIEARHELKRLQAGYRQVPINYDDPRSKEPLVPISDYGVQGVSYYSQPNNATIEAVPGVSPNIYVRRSIAEKLAAVDWCLQRDSQVAWALGGPARLYVRDGFRSPELCSYLFNTAIPELIRRNNPDWDDAKVLEETKKKIADPTCTPQSVPPHFTGGAVDAILVSAESGAVLDTGFKAGHIASEAVRSDYLETLSDHELATDGLEQALITRRVLHNVMHSADPLAGGVCMINNPRETWHFSRGDQLWAQISARHEAYYGMPEPEQIPAELWQAA